VSALTNDTDIDAMACIGVVESMIAEGLHIKDAGDAEWFNYAPWAHAHGKMTADSSILGSWKHCPERNKAVINARAAHATIV
jgi:hypothetical protein